MRAPARSHRPRLARLIRSPVAAVAVMAALAYVPALRSSPGRMPADTKLYLYLDPGRLVSDSIWTFDGRQFAGWVPHQMIAYLWPSGPWYAVAGSVGLPDWVAHRLWIGTIMLAAGTGVAWACRRLGLTVPAAIAAGLVYQLSPYLVPYISRTSSMLLPWAGLGWIVGLTVGAATRSRWRDAALCALVIGTCGAVNATAALMVAPAPLLYLVVAAAERTVPLRRVVGAAARISVLTLGTSAWWIAMLVIQRRHGADLLAYSESLEDVSFTATSPEVWRSLGYWLMYIRDPYAPTTTAGSDYMTDGRPLYLGFALVIVALLGLALTRFPARRFAIALTFAGLVLAVGVHPFDAPSPVARLVRGDGQEGLSLALRSSTRAIPVMTIGLALGAGALIDAIGGRHRIRSLAAVAAVGLVAAGNLPVLTGNRLVDPALARDEHVPDAWHTAADALDAMPDGYRVLQLPGAEFGAFTWGYTVDPPLPALTDRPLVTRDLLPLGSPAAMDLLYALDDRFQVGVEEIDAVAPIARLLGADAIWLTGDAAFDRFRTPRPELTSASFARGGWAGLDDPVPYGEPRVNAPRVPMTDEEALSEIAVGTPVAPVELVPVDSPVPVVRASATEVLVAGSGDGLIDAAAAGLIDGSEAIHYSASMTAEQLAAVAERAAAVIVTDTNRKRAHHWRTSQDVSGYTEPAGGPAVLWDDSGDARLPVFPDAQVSAATVSRSDGPVRAVATSYGERFVYLPETRAALAIDGDPNTAWTVADPAFQYIEVTTDRGVDHVTLLQPFGLDAVRHLRTAMISVNGGDEIEVALDDRSLLTGQLVELPATDGPTTIRITLGEVVGADNGGRPDRTGVGFAEIDLGIGDSPELIVTPTDLTDAMRAAGVDRPVTWVLTRDRVRATNRWRADPEWRIARAIDAPFDQTATVAATVRLDRRASDAVLAGLLGIAGPTATARLSGVPAAGGWAAADGDPDTAWVTPFNAVVRSTIGVELLDPAVPITITQRRGDYSVVTAVRLVQGANSATVTLPAADRRGVSTIDVPDGFTPGPLSIEIDAVNARTTRDRRFADTVVMPAAIAEVGNVAAATIPQRFDTGCRVDLLSVDGVPVPLRVTGPVAAAFAGDPLDATLCDEDAVELAAGEHVVTGQQSRRIGLEVDRVVLDGGDRSEPAAPPTATVVERGRLDRTISVDGCPDGCWLMVGEGYHPSWSATTADVDLDGPRLVSGGFNGWWIPPRDGPLTVWVRWTAQPPLNAALAAAAAVSLAAIAIAARDRPARPHRHPERARWLPLRSDGLRRSTVAAGVWVAAAALFVEPRWAWWGLAGGAALIVTRRIRVAALVAVAGVARIAVDVVTTVRAHDPPPTPTFPGRFEDLHRLGLFAAVALLVSAFATRRARRPRGR